MKLFSKIVLGVLCVATVASVAGVAASWQYAGGEYQTVENDGGVGLTTFIWEGSDNLHGGTGEDHKQLLDTMIEDLNSDNSVLEAQIDAREKTSIFKWNKWDTYGSMDMRDDTTLSNIFELDTQGLEFLIYFPEKSPNTRYIYTTSVELGTSGWGQSNAKPNYPIGTSIYPIYRTTLVLNSSGDWKATITELGSAPSKFYDNDTFGGSVYCCPSFDASKWAVGKLGTSTGNAIYAYVGLNTTAYVDSETEQTYYALTCSRNTTYTVTSTNANCTIVIIYNNKVQYTSSLVDGKQTVSFKANSNATYYIRLSGAKDMPFTIS